MANKKISELPTATAPDGSELVEIVQGGINKQATVQDLADLTPDGWLVTGTTEVTDPIINITGQLTFLSTEATIDIGNTPNGVLVLANQFKAGTQGDEAYIQISGTTSADILITAADDINIAAGQTGSGHDVNITSNYGHTHITTGAAGVLLTTTGPLTVNADTGSSGEVLTSNGAGAAPTWQSPSGGAATEYTISTETTSYTLDAADKTAADGGAKLYFIMDSATGVNFTVPADATVNFAIGTEIIVQRAVNTGQITFVEGGAANITPSAGNLLDAGQSISMSLVKTAANEWVLQNGSTAGQFVDYTTTFSGFSVNPTSVTSRFSLVGKICFVYILCGGDGTSNATTFTLTLPLPPRNNEAQMTNFTTNNTLTLSTPGRIVWTAGNTTATLSRDMAGTAWTASGGKRANISIFYEIQ